MIISLNWFRCPFAFKRADNIDVLTLFFLPPCRPVLLIYKDATKWIVCIRSSTNLKKRSFIYIQGAEFTACTVADSKIRSRMSKNASKTWDGKAWQCFLYLADRPENGSAGESIIILFAASAILLHYIPCSWILWREIIN